MVVNRQGNRRDVCNEQNELRFGREVSQVW